MTNITFENIRSKASLYGLDVNQYWQNIFEPDTGAVKLSNLLFRNFTGSVADGAKRPPLYLIGNDLFLAQNVTVDGFSLWTETGTTVVNKINNFYGKGVGVYTYGANNGLGITKTAGATPTFTSTITVTASPTGWVAPTYPAWAVPTTGYGSMYCISFLLLLFPLSLRNSFLLLHPLPFI